MSELKIKDKHGDLVATIADNGDCLNPDGTLHEFKEVIDDETECNTIPIEWEKTGTDKQGPNVLTGDEETMDPSR